MTVVEGAEQEQEQRWWSGVGMLIVINMSGKEGKEGGEGWSLDGTDRRKTKKKKNGLSKNQENERTNERAQLALMS